MRLALLSICLAPLPASAQLAVRSAASYGEDVAAGGVAALFASELPIPTAAGQVDKRGRWPRELGGARVEVDGAAAGLLFVSAGQINFVVPADVDAGTATVSVVSADNGVLASGTAEVRSSAPALFSANGSGSGPGLLFNLVTDDRGPFGVLTQANPGCDKRTRLSLLATGLRPLPEQASDSISSNIAEKVRVFVEGAPGGSVEIAEVLYAGPDESLEGIDRIDFVTPAELERAGEVTIRVEIGGASSNAVTLTLADEATTPAADCVSDGFIFAHNTVVDLLAGDLWDVTDVQAAFARLADTPPHWPLMGVGSTAVFQRNGEVIAFGTAGAPELIWADPEFPPSVRTLEDQPIPFVAIAAGNPDHAIEAEAEPGRPIHQQVIELAQANGLAFAGVRVSGRFTSLSYSVAHNLLKEGTPLTDPAVDKAPFQLFFDADPESKWELSGFYAASPSVERVVSVEGAPAHLHGFQMDRSRAGHVGATDVGSATIRLYPLSAPVIQDADLAVRILSAEADRVAFQVLNRGESTIARTTVQGLEGEQVVFQMTLSAFSPGEVKTTAPVPSSPPGAQIVVDPFNDVLESDEANNTVHVKATP